MHMQEIKLRSIRGVDVRGKRVLLRTSLNPAVDGDISDDRRLLAALPTLQLLAKGGARLLVAGYFGRDNASLKPIFEALHKLAPDIPMRFCGGSLKDAAREISSLREGSVLVLENTRKDPGEEANAPAYARELASLAELYVGDAFAEAHRPYASNVGVAALLPSYAGLLMEEEVRRLSFALTPPHPSLAIIGGAKFETKSLLIERLLPLYDSLLIGGAIANDFLKARGVPIGASKTSEVPLRGELSDIRIKIPEDMVAADPEGESRETVRVEEGESIADIGPGTARSWAKMISGASFVLWNGPMGIYEKGFMQGTNALAKAIARSPCRAVIGGGDTDAALARYKFDSERVFVSTGGGAMLAFLSGEKLPGLEVLRV